MELTVASWRPDIAVQVAFNAAPNDPSAIPIWNTTVTYELAGQGGDPETTSGEAAA